MRDFITAVAAIVALAVLLLIFLSRHSATQAGDTWAFPTLGRDDSSHPLYDLWGNKYPELCRTAVPGAPFLVWQVDTGYADDGRKRIGAFWKPGLVNRLSVVAVDPTIRDKMTQQEVLRHERCHLIMWEQTGNADWHPN